MYADDITVYCIGQNVDKIIPALNEKNETSPHVEFQESTKQPSNQN